MFNSKSLFAWSLVACATFLFISSQMDRSDAQSPQSKSGQFGGGGGQGGQGGGGGFGFGGVGGQSGGASGGFAGGQGGAGGFGMNPFIPSSSMAANESFVYVLHNNTLQQYLANDLTLVKSIEIGIGENEGGQKSSNKRAR